MKALYGSNRGYVFTNDLMTAILIYLAALSLLTGVWAHGKTRIAEGWFVRSLQSKADIISQTLAKTPGLPIDWEERPTNETLVPGLARKKLVLDDSKIEGLNGLGSQSLEKMFGLEPGSLSVSISQSGETLLEAGGYCTGDYVVESRRLASFQNRTANLVVRVCGNYSTGVFP